DRRRSPGDRAALATDARAGAGPPQVAPQSMLLSNGPLIGLIVKKGAEDAWHASRAPSRAPTT
ncbi:MAG: hypothetical protein ABI193_19660, partial [Minicystis sp.]